MAMREKEGLQGAGGRWQAGDRANGIADEINNQEACGDWIKGFLSSQWKDCVERRL